MKITITTVGYGDLLPEFWFEKVFAIFFMPISTAALATTITRFAEMRPTYVTYTN